MFGFFSTARRDTPPPPIVDHPDFTEISRMPPARTREAEIDTAFQRDYGLHRICAESAARLV